MSFGLFPRLLLSLLLLLLVSNSFMGYVLLTEARDSIDKSRLQQAHTLAKGLAEGSLDALATRDYELLERWLKATTPIEDFAYAYFSRSDGVILAHTQAKLIAKKMAPLEKIGAPFVREVTYLGRPVREVIHSAYLGDRHMANAHLAYFLDAKPFYAEDVVPRLIIILLASMIILALATFFILRRSLKPVETLSGIIEKTTDYLPDLPDELINRKDEVGLLARDFSNLMQRLSSSYNNLFKEKEFNQITMDSIADAVIVTDEKGCIQYMNYVAEKLTGWFTKEAKGQSIKNIFSIINASTRNPVVNPVDTVLSTGEVVYLSNHTILISRNATEYHISDSAAPIKKEDNNILGVVLVFNDVTERKQADEKIRTLYQAIEQSPVSVMVTDTDANIEYVNSTFEQITGYLSTEVLGQNPRMLKSGKTPPQLYREMWQTITSGKAWQGEMMNRKKNGELYWENIHITPVIYDSGTISNYLAVKEDITLRKQQEKKILYQAHFDALTDLPNRFLSLDRLSQLMNEAQRNNRFVAVLFIDLDDFKKINDTLGHDTGDKLLIEAAARLRSGVRDGDTVGRLGGDEFIVLLGGLSGMTDARPVVENLLSKFRDAFRIDGRELMITASVGISVYPNDGDSSSVLLRNADSAMYHSKGEGRNTYTYFTDAMNKDVSRRLALEEQMHGALDRNELYVYYQPKVDVTSCNIIGVEALLRWNNPALGEITPDEFIPIAEQTGLIMPIGQFVLAQALEMMASWQQQYKQPFTTAVNLSPRQFRDPNLVAFIKEAMTQSGVLDESLELEITEGVLMSGHTHIDKALVAIHNLGIKLSMDDFGTGYSSLSYLRRYPFDILKIDRSFIDNITYDLADRELVNAAIAMAHSLGLKVVAEGVETEEQLALLATQGCEIAQGYLFSKPVSAEKITEILISDKGNFLPCTGFNSSH